MTSEGRPARFVARHIAFSAARFLAGGAIAAADTSSGAAWCRYRVAISGGIVDMAAMGTGNLSVFRQALRFDWLFQHGGFSSRKHRSFPYYGMEHPGWDGGLISRLRSAGATGPREHVSKRDTKSNLFQWLKESGCDLAFHQF